MRAGRVAAFAILVAAAGPTGRGATEPSAAVLAGAPGPKRVYVATRLQGAPPKIDGRLDDACWQTLGTWAGDYTQFGPRHGGAPTEPSDLKVLYDDTYLYVAIRAFDSQPELMTRFAGPRDQFAGDAVGITFDSYYDHRTGYEFDLTAAGQKLDLTLANEDWDSTWNAVWDGKVSHDDRGWYAEMRIPLHQLRYNDRHPQVWGLHSWRWLARNSEESQWKLLASDNTGFVYSFGELQGLELPKPRRHLELVPYASVKATWRDPEVPGRRQEQSIAGGVDAKLQLTTSFTLDATVNPDFGQVEADPAEMNLTAFETFLQERRPFFLEGRNILDFSITDDEPLFYSRRIGHAPSLAAPAGATDVPESTAILGAWKVTGKSEHGLAVGVLHAATAEEHARYVDATGAHTFATEPATQYVVARARQDFNGGNTTLGGIATTALRSLKTPALREALPRESIVAGLDFEHYWADRTYSIAARAIGTQVRGSPAAISALQTSSARYFQRPDADYVTYDPTRRSLSGWGAYLMAGKRSKGHWRYHEKVTALSPGLDFNDLGYLREADRIKQHTELAYVEKAGAHLYRTYELNLENNNLWNFGGEHLKSEVSLHAGVELQNKGYLDATVTVAGETLDPTALRGGPALRLPRSNELWLYARTDAEKRWVWSMNYHALRAEHADWSEEYFAPKVQWRPIPALTFSLAAETTRRHDRRYYISARNPDGTPAEMVAELRSHALAYTFRAQWFIRPELSLQYVGNPFGSSGSSSGFALVTAPRAAAYSLRTRSLPTPTRSGSDLIFDENRDGVADLHASRPDFSDTQFRSNLVLRWEFRPGSNLYLVWSQERSDRRDAAAGTGTVLRRLSNAPQTNVVLLKCSYWFSL